MQGLYRTPNEDSFIGDDQIKRELYLAGHHPDPDFVTPISTPRTFQQWSARFRSRQEEAPRQIAEVQLFDTSLITFQSDLHIGGKETDYHRIEQEAELIANSPGSMVVLLGDLIDNFSFLPPAHEAQEAVPAQIEYAKSLIKYYADHKKLLAVWQGNHETWTSRQGIDLYSYLLDGIQTYFFFGEAYLGMNVLDEKYRMTGSHEFRGFSQYNTTHGQNRAIRFGGAWGSDVIVSGHWHEKGIAQQPFYEYGGKSIQTTMIALGTYKANDNYLRNNGFPNRDPNAMYGASVILDKDRHVVTPFYDVVEAHRQFPLRK